MTGLGTIIVELIGIEKGFEYFGEWLKKKTGNSGVVSHCLQDSFRRS